MHMCYKVDVHKVNLQKMHILFNYTRYLISLENAITKNIVFFNLYRFIISNLIIFFYKIV